jgi:hypothetical protein
MAGPRAGHLSPHVLTEMAGSDPDHDVLATTGWVATLGLWYNYTYIVRFSRFLRAVWRDRRRDACSEAPVNASIFRVNASR